MAHWRDGSEVKAFAVLPEDQTLIPSSYTQLLTTACNTSSNGFYSHFWPPVGTYTHWHSHTQYTYTHTYRHTNLKNLFKTVSNETRLGAMYVEAMSPF